VREYQRLFLIRLTTDHRRTTTDRSVVVRR